MAKELSGEVEIITIGDEILIGQIVDTNSAFIAQLLNLNGISVKQISSVSDDRKHILKALVEAKSRADIIAASISDGIFLLRGEEIVYVNPTGEKILGVSLGAFTKGLRLGDQFAAWRPGGRDAFRIGVG